MLNNLKIRNKLAALLALPIIALLVFASVGWRERSNTASQAQRDEQIVAAAASTQKLVTALNAESTVTVEGLAPKSGQLDPSVTKQLKARRVATDAAAKEFLTANNALHLDPATTAGQGLEGVKSQFDSIKTERLQLGTGGVSGQDWKIEIDTYRNSYLRAVLHYMQSLATVTTTPEVVLPLEQLQALLTYASDSIAVGNNAVGVYGQGGWVRPDATFDGQKAHDAAVTSTQDGVGNYLEIQQTSQDVLKSISAGSTEGNGSNTLFDQTNSSMTQGNVLNLALSPWSDPSNLSNSSNPAVKDTKALATDVQGENTQFAKIGSDFVGNLTHDINVRRSNAVRAAQYYVLFAFLVILAAVVLAILIARSITLRVHKLTVAADRLSHEQLPRLVDSLKNPAEDDVGYLTSSFADIDVRGSDEIGHLAGAFNRIQGVAVEVATEQAQLLRKGIGDMFVNLARRNQGLLDRQIEFIDQLEAAEEDPDQLENLFRLDHLATRMRRNAESLLVLAGAEPNRRRGKPVPLADVVRAAVGEVEDFARIDMLQFDEVLVASNAALDIAHLLSELMENSANFSPPDSRVEVVGHRTKAEGYVISVADHGIGMTAEQLAEANDLLARPPLVGLALSRSLGFIVIGRLAARFGIAVRLMPSPSGGTTAMVSLPPSLITDQPRSSSGPGAIQTSSDEAIESAPPDASSLLDSGDGRPPARRRGASGSGSGSAGDGGAPAAPPTPPPASDGATLAKDARAAERRQGAPPTAPKRPARPAPAPKAKPESVPEPATAATPASNGARAEAPPAAATASGLTKRVPRSAGGARAVPGGDGKRAATQNRRSPDEVRSMLSNYRSGMEKGRGEDTDANSSEDTKK